MSAISHMLSLPVGYDNSRRAMTILEALAVLEDAVSECKKRNVNTQEVSEALELLEPYVRPEWIIPQFVTTRSNTRADSYVEREGQQQVLCATFPGIRDSITMNPKRKSSN